MSTQYVAVCFRPIASRYDKHEFEHGTEVVFGPFCTPEGALAEATEHDSQDCEGNHVALEINAPYTQEAHVLPPDVTVEEVAFCHCTNDALEAGSHCNHPSCPGAS